MHDEHARTARGAGIGTALPPRILRNEDFERMLDTSDEWIVARTGMRERHVVSEGESVATLAVTAGKRALADAGVAAEDVELVVLATATPEQPVPSTSTIIQPALAIIYGSLTGTMSNCAPAIARACSALLRAPQGTTGLTH